MTVASRTLLLSALFAMIALAGCGGATKDAPGPMSMTPEDQEAWEIRLVEMRIDKNDQYMDPQQSPLMLEDIPGFEGLNYYWPVPELRFRVPFEAAASADTVMMTKRKGSEVPYLRKGTVSFKHADEVHTLAVFGPVDTTRYGDYLWLPFHDETSGTETYGGGRYIDLELDAEGYVDLDFNFAYNPLCDYNHEKYNCTLPPAENRLGFPVIAGEKLFRLEE